MGCLKACRCFPHGMYGFVVTLIVTTGWLMCLFDDGCNYSIVSGENMMSVLTDGVVSDLESPFIEIGFRAFRLPKYDSATSSWNIDRTGACIAFPEQFEIDSQWTTSKIFHYAALIVGGTAALNLWTSIFFSFTKCSWRILSLELFLACIFMGISFVWFQTDLCSIEFVTAQMNKQNTTIKTNLNQTTIMEFPYIGEVEVPIVATTSCKLSDGAKADIIGCSLWFLGLLFVCCYYPQPSGDKIDEEETDGFLAENNKTNERNKSSRTIV